jgi:hypothetical protein
MIAFLLPILTSAASILSPLQTLLTFLVTNWKVTLGALAILGAAYALHVSSLHGYQKRVDEEHKQEINLLQDRIATLSHLASLDAQRAQDDAKQNAQLETLSRDTPKNDGPCLDAAAAHRVWALRGAQGLPAPTPPGRIADVFQKRHQRPGSSPHAR